MIAALRTEVRKITTTRAWWINASVMFAYMVVMAGIMAASFAVSRRAADEDVDVFSQRTTFVNNVGGKTGILCV